MDENLTVFAKSSPVQATAKLTIKDFVEVMPTSEPGDKYNSDTFMVGDTPMAISVFPNGDKKDTGGNVGVFLCNESDADVTAKCQFITDAAKNLGQLDHEVKANSTWGFPKFFSRDKCTNFYKLKDFVVTAQEELCLQEPL